MSAAFSSTGLVSADNLSRQRDKAHLVFWRHKILRHHDETAAVGCLAVGKSVGLYGRKTTNVLFKNSTETVCISRGGVKKARNGRNGCAMGGPRL